MPGTRSRGGARAPAAGRGAQRGGRPKRAAQAAEDYLSLPGTILARQKCAQELNDIADDIEEDAANEPHLGPPKARRVA